MALLEVWIDDHALEMTEIPLEEIASDLCAVLNRSFMKSDYDVSEI